MSHSLTQTKAIQSDARRIADLRGEMNEELDALPPVDDLDPHCEICKTTTNLRDSEECFDCYDRRIADRCEQAGLDRAYAEYHERVR